MMLPSSPNSLQSFDSAKVINIHELAELIGPLSCIIAGDWSEALRLLWTRAGEAAGPWERRVHTSRPGLFCKGACGLGRTMDGGARSSSASRLPSAPYIPPPETRRRLAQPPCPPGSPAAHSSDPPLTPDTRDPPRHRFCSRCHSVLRSARVVLKARPRPRAWSGALEGWGWNRGRSGRPTERRSPS